MHNTCFHPRSNSLTLSCCQVLCHTFARGERVSCQLCARILRNMSIHSEYRPSFTSLF
jgi:hypothetical protein